MGWKVKTDIGGQTKYSLWRFQYDFIKIFAQGLPKVNFLHFLGPKSYLLGSVN